MKFETYCAANSGDGFISFFPSLLDEKKKQIFYIKGGPGCGKSTLFKKIAARTEEAELIRCSGDPHSLDGVILPDKNTLLIDATAPHAHEPQYPGVGGSLIDLGIGWDPTKLNKNLIISLSDRKKALYQECYSLLKSAKYLHQSTFQPLLHHLDLSKIQSIGDKILRQNALWGSTAKESVVQKRFLSGITAEGLLTQEDTFRKLGRNVILLEDRWMISSILLQYLEEHLTRNGIDHINGYHPLLGKDCLQHLIIPSAALSIVSRDGLFPANIPEENIIRKITVQSLLDKIHLERNKNKLTFIKRLQREILDLAVKKLEEAKSVHLMIEQEYAKGTDYKRINDLQEKIINNLLNEP